MLCLSAFGQQLRQSYIRPTVGPCSNYQMSMDGLDLIPSTRSLILDLPPSCAQFCPAHPKYLVVGTYNLQEENPGQEPRAADEHLAAPKHQSRNGTLVVFKLDGDEL